MNVIFWNCRGTANKGFSGLIRDIKQDFSCAMVIVMETHTSGTMASRIAKKCGLDKPFIVDVRGQSSGIWLLWNSEVWKVEVLGSSSQLIHMKVAFKHNSPCFLTTCYGSLHYVQRQDLWRQLRDIHVDLSGPWAIMGDLNATLSPNERSGPPFASPLRPKSGLANAINLCNLIDAGYVGDPFTWEIDGTRKRLDCMLVNLDWRIRFNEVEVHHLPFYKSDHHPLLIKFEAISTINRHRRPFRFEVAWLTHGDFDRVVMDTWDQNSVHFLQQLGGLQSALKVWNKETLVTYS